MALRMSRATPIANATRALVYMPAKSTGRRCLATVADPIKFEHAPKSPENLHYSPTHSIGNTLHKRSPFWQSIKRWENVSERDFLTYAWQTKGIVQGKNKLLQFLNENVSDVVPKARTDPSVPGGWMTKAEFVGDVEAGIDTAPMSLRLTPYVLSLANWSDPVNDPIRRQFIPLKSSLVNDHALSRLDSLGEEKDSPVNGIVHRYPDKVLFLAVSICPVYCRFCTRSYAIGPDTGTVSKLSKKPIPKRWEAMFRYIESKPAVQDVVVSGGDAYYLDAPLLKLIGDRLLSIPHVKRIRFASKGLAVNPTRFLDDTDGWTHELIALSKKSRSMGKHVALHTHFNHPREITWITELAARRLHAEGVVVRNQTVLLRGVNDDAATMSSLIRGLADLNIAPYYVYQGDMVPGLDDLRTPLSTSLRLEREIRGTIAGFCVPAFVVDLPGGGGKRLANSFESYDRETGVSTWKAPGVAGDRVFEYHDPRPS